jgi:hypothetical protein
MLSAGLNAYGLTSPASKKKSSKAVNAHKKKVLSTPAGLNTSEAIIKKKQ